MKIINIFIIVVLMCCAGCVSKTNMWPAHDGQYLTDTNGNRIVVTPRN